MQGLQQSMVVVMLQLALLLVATLYCSCSLAQSHDLNSMHYFPESIPHYPIRRDIHTNDAVSRGRLHLINYSSLTSAKLIPLNSPEQKTKMVRFADLERNLQCASPEPELDGNRGSWSMIKMAPPTRQSIEQICAWAETKCEPWRKCRESVKQLKAGMYDKQMDNLGREWLGRTAILVRVINNTAYYDWPWGMERFKPQEPHYSELLTDHMALLEMVLRTVSDIGDSVFFFGGEQAFLKWNVPMPLFSFAPDIMYGDLPFPWLESYKSEFFLEKDAEAAKDYSDTFYKRTHKPWQQRVAKAAFFASFQNYRQLIYDSAALRPDLFDVSFSMNNRMKPWNPLSDEPELDVFDPNHPSTDKKSFTVERNHTGYLQPLYQFADSRHYIPHHYKYVVVCVGSGALSTSGRLAQLLAHSGAVVLLQASSFSYHFSARLVPWVHYVPLSFSMADVIDKVQWLQQHDAQARQIVANAENFARSYLRMEDYFCYAAGALKMISELNNKTDALQGFSPKLIHRVGNGRF